MGVAYTRGERNGSPQEARSSSRGSWKVITVALVNRETGEGCRDRGGFGNRATWKILPGLLLPLNQLLLGSPQSLGRGPSASGQGGVQPSRDPLPLLLAVQTPCLDLGWEPEGPRLGVKHA